MVPLTKGWGDGSDSVRLLTILFFSAREVPQLWHLNAPHARGKRAANTPETPRKQASNNTPNARPRISASEWHFFHNGPLVEKSS